MGLFDRMLGGVQAKFGENVYVAPDHLKNIYGVPIGPLSLQYLFSSDVLPLERVVGITGPKGGCKSTLGFEFIKMVLADGGGYGSIVDTENKASEVLIRSVVGDELEKNVMFSRADTVETAQNQILSSLSAYLEAATEDLKKGEYKPPLAVLYDSLGGSMAEESVDKIDKEGFADKSFPKEALITSRFFGALEGKLIGQPLLLLVTNHESEDVGNTGPMKAVRNPRQAKADYYFTYHFRVQSMGHLTSTINKGKLLKITTKKSSFGIDDKTLQVEVHWENYKQDDKTAQKTWFNWDRATVEMLLAQPKTLVSDLLTITKANNQSYSCKKFELKDVPAEEIGRAIQADKDLMLELQVRLGIFQNRKYQPPKPEPKAEAKAKAKGKVVGDPV